MPPSTVTDVTQQLQLLTVKRYFIVLYSEKKNIFKVGKGLCLNASSGVKQVIVFSEKAFPFHPVFQERYACFLCVYFPASSVFTLCGNGIDGKVSKCWCLPQVAREADGNPSLEQLAAYSMHPHRLVLQRYAQ